MSKQEEIPAGKEITGPITKHMDRRFMSSLDLVGVGEITLTIDRVMLIDTLKYGNGDTNENVKLLYFTETPKPLALCDTNIKALIVILGSNKPADWKGRKIVMHTEKVMAFGKQVDAVRFVKEGSDDR